MEQTSISRTVMRRVRTIHAVRPFFSATSLAMLFFIIALWGIGREVWVAHVFQNLQVALHAGTIGRFLVVAFENTRAVVQALTLVGVFAFIWMLVSGIRTLAALPTRRFA